MHDIKRFARKSCRVESDENTIESYRVYNTYEIIASN